MGELFSADNIWKLGIVAAAVVSIIFMMLKSPKGGLYLLAAMLFLAGLGLPKDAEKGTEYRTWLFSIQDKRNFMYAGCAALMCLGLFAHASKINPRYTAPLSWLYVFLNVLMGMIIIIQPSGGPMAGFLAIIFAVLTMVPMMLLISAVLKEWDDWIVVLRFLALGALAWTIACTVQFGIDQSVLITGSGRRFVGLSGNPQHAAGLSAVLTVTCTWLFLNDPKKRWKLLWAAIAASHVVFVLWTGSRTGLITTVAGLTAIFYARIGKAVLFAPVVAGAVYGLVLLATEMGVKFGFERLTSSSDTRSDKWSTMWETGMSNPVIGVGLTEAGGSENGFLYGFASFGITVPMVLLVMMIVTGFLCMRLVANRFGAQPHVKRLIDLCIGFFTMYWLGNMAEGYGVARMSPQLVFFLTFSTLAYGLLIRLKDEAAAYAAGYGEYEQHAVDQYGQEYGWAPAEGQS